MKKLFFIIASMVILCGCSLVKDSPKSRVEEYLSKYQKMDSEVLAQLEGVIENDGVMNDKQRKDYQALLEKQYQNLSYKIKDEDIVDDTATVVVEIEVFDYANSIVEAKNYYLEHKDEFESDENFIDFKISELMNVKDKNKYEITFGLHKEDDKWVLDEVGEDVLLKIHGLYED